MSGANELTYSELRCKDIINSADGRRLGRILDIVFTSKGNILGIIAPLGRRGLFFKLQEVYIPFKCIKKIGEDIILVELVDSFSHGHKHKFDRNKRGSDGVKNYYGYEPECKEDHGCDSHGDGHGHHDGHGHDGHGHHDGHDGAKHSHDNHASHKVYDYDGGHRNQGGDHCQQHSHSGHTSCGCDGHGGAKQNHEHHASHKVYDYDGGHNHSGHRSDNPNCDRRCEKCMLFDCLYRWGERRENV